MGEAALRSRALAVAIALAAPARAPLADGPAARPAEGAPLAVRFADPLPARTREEADRPLDDPAFAAKGGAAPPTDGALGPVPGPPGAPGRKPIEPSRRFPGGA